MFGSQETDTGQVAEWIEELQHEHEGQSLCAGAHNKRMGGNQCVTHGTGMAETGHSFGKVLTRLAKSMSSGFSGRPCLRKIRWRVVREGRQVKLFLCFRRFYF